MKVGLIARAEDRGLGLQTWELFRHLEPDHTVVVDMGQLARGFPMHLDRYGLTGGARSEPGVRVARFCDDRFVDELVVRELLEACDVIYTAETFYDARVPGWAEAAGCTVVVHINPEFFRGVPPNAGAVRWWAPTPWRLEHLPASTRVVPVPVATDRFTHQVVAGEGPLRVLHVAGHRAAHDRNGTTDLMRALRHVTEPMRVEVITQDDTLPVPQRMSSTVDLVRTMGGVEQYWQLYDGHQVLVMPRRYGGLCLPVQEALAAGLAVVMPDVPPNSNWGPVHLIRARLAKDTLTPAGTIRRADTDTHQLAAFLDLLAREPRALLDSRLEGLAWAQDHSWDELVGLYRAELARAAA